MSGDCAFYAMVRLIAIHLGNYWTYNELKENEYCKSAYVNCKSGGSIHFYNDTYRKRISVSGVFPDSIDGRSTSAQYWGLVPNNSDYGSITISPNRNPKDAANDIRRRLVNDYVRLYPLALKKKADSQAEIEKAKYIIDAIRRVCNARDYEAKNDPRNPVLAIDNYHTDGPRGKIEYSTYDGRIDISLSDLHPDCAIQMLALMQNYHNAAISNKEKTK